mmetsp:Transcript_25070/g.56903  ORF Transcript_25070/g.56903 Transcript_25070/m.56903 type:complete len:84 (-) Transcript_25070:2792-3043(-)
MWGRRPVSSAAVVVGTVDYRHSVLAPWRAIDAEVTSGSAGIRWRVSRTACECVTLLETRVVLWTFPSTSDCADSKRTMTGERG